ncbi:MAG: SDR family oxidoreductase [Candidatus Hydrogenedentes bacterium]|nr:SDR family oxidoreductase [Candidatus Hydrogenedentota bacterium]
MADATTRPSVVILGATSTIAKAAAHEFARRGHAVVLGAQDHKENKRHASDIALRYNVPCHALRFDAQDFKSHAAWFEECKAALGGVPTGVVLCFGFMDEQANAQASFEIAQKTIDINLTGAVSILEIVAAAFEMRKSGFIGVVSSVAGDRGRQTNYIYGCAKAGLTTYCQGLRNRLFASGVSVTTIKPGFVDTKMTYGLPLPGPLVATPEKAGAIICKAVLARKHEVYVPFFWRFIMLIIRSIPEFQFKKMKI